MARVIPTDLPTAVHSTELGLLLMRSRVTCADLEDLACWMCLKMSKARDHQGNVGLGYRIPTEDPT